MENGRRSSDLRRRVHCDRPAVFHAVLFAPSPAEISGNKISLHLKFCDHSVVDQLPEHFLSDEDLPGRSRVLSDLRIKREGSSYPELRKEPENVFSYLNIFRFFPFDLLFSSFILHCTSEHYLIDLYSPYASTLPFRRRSPALIISVLDVK